MNCRGHETRQRIVRDYEVQPEAHIKLLANQQKHSDAGATIEDEYKVNRYKYICRYRLRIEKINARINIYGSLGDFYRSKV